LINPKAVQNQGKRIVIDSVLEDYPPLTLESARAMMQQLK